MYSKYGWSYLYDDGKPSVNYKEEMKYNIKRIVIDIFCFIPFLIVLMILYFII